MYIQRKKVVWYLRRRWKKMTQRREMLSFEEIIVRNAILLPVRLLRFVLCYDVVFVCIHRERERFFFS